MAPGENEFDTPVVEDSVTLKMAHMLLAFEFLKYYPHLRYYPLFLCYRVKLTHFGVHSLLYGTPLHIWTTTTCGGQWITWERR